ncbi:MAG: hypothetical protein ACU841_16225 [Gammaproteobacteria bacterium]
MPRFSIPFDQAGRFPYFCTLHWQMGMTGVVAVNDPDAPPKQFKNPVKNRIRKGSVKIKLTPIAEGLIAPNWGISAPGDGGRLFVTDQAGIVWVITLATGQKQVFADLSSLLVPLGIGQDAQGKLYLLENGTGIPFGLTGGVWKIESP